MKNTLGKFEQSIDGFGILLVRVFHLLALFAIGATIVWAAAHTVFELFSQSKASVEDILLLFIYLELGAMVGIYFKTNRMPVRFLIYIAITALTRLMIEVANVKHNSGIDVIYVAGAILILTASVFVTRYGSYMYPSAGLSEEELDTDEIKGIKIKPKRSSA